MKKMLLLLMLIPLASAAPWETTALLAVTTSTALLAILYMVGMGFGLSELQMMAKEEFFQLLALGIMLAAFVGTNGLIDGISTTPAFTEGGAATLQQAASNSLTASLASTKGTFIKIASFDMNVSREASKSDQCSVMGVGYSVSACGGYSLLATPLSMAGGIAGFAMGELSAMKRLIDISSAYSLSFLLPLGIILRTFKLTRGAGGLLIALGISMHLMLPAGVIFNDMLAATFLASTSPFVAPYKGTASNTVVECDAADVGTGSSRLGQSVAALKSGNSEDKAVAAYKGLREDIKKYLYVIMILATLGPVISLLMFAACLRALTSLAGAEVDVSAITRFV